MNGIVGRIELRAHDPVWIESQQVYPKNDGTVRVEVTVRNDRFDPIAGKATVTISEKATGKVVGAGSTDFGYGRGLMPDGRHILTSRATQTVNVKLQGEPKLWSEFAPELYVAKTEIRLAPPRATLGDVVTATFGFRDLGIRGTQFTMNGRPLKLRGTLECAIFPLTGYPPCDVAAWRRIYQIEKSYGLNFIRFHSWCPPEAAFEAADLEGIMIQAEGPQANVNAGSDPKRDAFLGAELERMVDTYGNHPSFCLMTLGNEFGGKDQVLSGWIDMLVKRDPRHLYSSASAAQTTANRQFTEGGPRGIHGPGTDADFRGTIAHDDRPLVGHEIGQWTFYPNFDEMAKYTGVLRPKNFEIVRDDLKAKGMLDLAPKFFDATGRQAVLLYKEEIEVLLRTPGHAGFSLLDLHDYPSQGTALIGLLDPFWDSKGFITPEAHHRYCGETVPLVRLKKRTFTADETLEATADVANFGPKDLAQATPQWTIRDAEGHEIAAGTLPSVDLPTGKLTAVGVIRAPLAKAAAPCKLSVAVSLPGTPYANDWDIWVYPPASGATGILPVLRPGAGETPVAPADVVVAHGWDDAKPLLAAGKRVVFLPKQTKFAQSLPGRFLPVFWSPIWFPDQKPNTMGILCDPKHPLFAQFPTESYSNWQWHELIEHSRAMILSDTPASFRPIVQVIDNFARNLKLGCVFEARVGDGRLLACTIDLSTDLDKRPAARQFLASLNAYAASDRFQPAERLDLAVLDRLFAPPVFKSTLAKLGAKVVEVDSEDADHDHLAAYAIDGSPDTFWHTRWGSNDDPMPHRLVIDLGREMEIRGVTYLPRLDMANGRIAEAEIYFGSDLKGLDKPIARAKWRNTDALQTVTFKRPARGRYLKLVVLSEIRKHPFAAVAEIDVVPAEHRDKQDRGR